MDIEKKDNKKIPSAHSFVRCVVGHQDGGDGGCIIKT
jgi:hypothetical protein